MLQMLTLQQEWAIVHALTDGDFPRDVARSIGCTERTVLTVWTFFVENGTVAGRVHRRPPTDMVLSLCDETTFQQLVRRLAAQKDFCFE